MNFHNTGEHVPNFFQESEKKDDKKDKKDEKKDDKEKDKDKKEEKESSPDLSSQQGESHNFGPSICSEVDAGLVREVKDDPYSGEKKS